MPRSTLLPAATLLFCLRFRYVFAIFLVLYSWNATILRNHRRTLYASKHQPRGPPNNQRRQCSWRIYIVSNRQPCLEQSEVSLLVVTQVGGVDVTPVNINQKWITQIETLNIQLANKAEKVVPFPLNRKTLIKCTLIVFLCTFSASSTEYTVAPRYFKPSGEAKNSSK